MWRFKRGRWEPRDKALMRRIRRIALPMQGPVRQTAQAPRQTRNAGFYHRAMALCGSPWGPAIQACARPH